MISLKTARFALGLLGVAALSFGCSRDPLRSGACTEKMEGACWTHLGLEGKWVTSLAETPWGLYAGTHDDGIFRMEPATGEWKPLGLDHAITSSILFVPGSAQRLLVGVMPYAEEQTEAAVFASEDRGDTWTPWDGGLAARSGGRAWAYSLAADPGNPERLFLGQSYPILRSEDGGLSWRYIWGSGDIFGMGVNSIILSPGRDGRMWAGGETGFYAGVILRSDDWGDTWKVFAPTPREENAVYTLTVDPERPDRLWAGVRSGLMISEDGGSSWKYTLSTRTPGRVHGIALTGTGVFAASTEDPHPESGAGATALGLYRSEDGGRSWEALRVPIRARGGRALTTDSQGRLLIGTRSGVWRVDP